MKEIKLNIPTLSPIIFRKNYIKNNTDEFIAANPFLSALHTQPSIRNYIHVSQNDVSSLEFLLSRMVELYKNRKKNPNNSRLISFYLSTVIAELFLSFKNQVVIATQKSDIFSSFKSLVHKQFKQNLNLKEYASQLNITPNHLNKRVKSETGKTASKIIKEITILEAKVLLLQTSMTISEISLELGIEDASYFSRLFKNETNSTPSDYREMIDMS